MAKKEAVAEVVATTKPILHDFEIIKEPVITEKSSLLSESSIQYTFIVQEVLDIKEKLAHSRKLLLHYVKAK